MKYIVKYYTAFNESWNNPDGKLCRHASYDEYEVESMDDCKAKVRDLLDCPSQKLTKQQVYEDFSSINNRMSDKDVKHILDYYNGRFELYNNILESLDKAGDTFSLQFNIPDKCNYFQMDCNNGVTQISAYIKIVAN